MKVLILNSDSPHNRGDRAILAGLIQLIQNTRPGAEITALSQFDARDGEWFGIRFLPFSPYSTNPWHYLKLLAEAKKADVVLWGGGELLKDYTNKLSLFYWLLKIFGIRLVNRNIIGVFQGIGPTESKIGKKVIVRTVNLCREFLLRDEESRFKLLDWGVKVSVTASYDPAVCISSDAADVSLNPELDQYGRGFIGLGLRRWFHYETGGWFPKKFKAGGPKTEKEKRYIAACAELADRLVEVGEKPLVFFPMHVSRSEDDEAFATEVIAQMAHADKAMLVSGDSLSPTDYLALIARADAFLGSRLHSTILATVAHVPSMCLYYVDKGRLFFEQLELDELAFPIERMLEKGFVHELGGNFEEVLEAGIAISKQQEIGLTKMRKKLRSDLATALGSIGL